MNLNFCAPRADAAVLLHAQAKPSVQDRPYVTSTWRGRPVQCFLHSFSPTWRSFYSFEYSKVVRQVS